MTAIAQKPEPTAAEWEARLGQWFKLKEAAAKAQAAERLARAELFGHFFPSPAEGTNTHILSDGFQLKGKYPIDRKVDEGALAGLRGATVGASRELLTAMNMPHAETPDEVKLVDFMRLSFDTLLNYTPALSVSAYRKLTAEQQRVVDMCLVIKPGSFNMEVTPPSTRNAAPTNQEQL